MAQCVFAYFHGHCQILIKSNEYYEYYHIFKITLLLTIHLAKIRFYRLITGNRPFTDQKVQKGLYYRPRSVNTDPLGNPVVPEVYRFHRFYWFQFLKVLLLKY